MELLDIRLTGLQRRNRAAFVRRSDLPGAPLLVAGHKVVLRDEEGDYFAGTVIDVDDQERCLVHLGVRLPEECRGSAAPGEPGPDRPGTAQSEVVSSNE